MSVPVVTLLCKSPRHARHTQSLLCSLFSMRRLESELWHDVSYTPDDPLNKLFPILGTNSLRFDSTASQCQETGTILHTLAMTTIDDIDLSEDHNPALMELLSVTALDQSSVINVGYIRKIRQILAHNLNKIPISTVSRLAKGIKLRLGRRLGVEITAQDLVANIPLLETPNNVIGNNNESSRKTGIRELVVPCFIISKTKGEPCFMSRLSKSALPRPVHKQSRKPIIGLYQWPTNYLHSLIIRPLPSAKSDLSTSLPSLIFQCKDIDKSIEDVKRHGASYSKIGFSGIGNGQVIVHHPALFGLDVRFCDKDQLSSASVESQHALLASSLTELQNPRVVSDGHSLYHQEVKAEQKADGRDCWIEFRANLKQPSGYFPSTMGNHTSRPRVAKIPDIPYE